MSLSISSHVLSEDERKVLPSDDEVRFYREHGWYLSRKLLSDEEVDAMVKASEAFYSGHRDCTLPSRPPRLAYWEPKDGNVFRHNDCIFYEFAEIRRILSKPVIGAVAARLAGSDQIRLFNTTLMFKPSNMEGQCTVVPWHFDRHYWQACTSEEMLTAFIPLHDCDEEMGTITMVDGSHRWREIGADVSTVRHFAERDPASLEQLLEENAAANGSRPVRVPMRIPKGAMSFHHCRTYHGSGPNRSTRPRRAISLHLQDRHNRYRPFRLENGELLQYNHDVLVRRTIDGPDYADPEFCPILWEGAL